MRYLPGLLLFIWTIAVAQAVSWSYLKEKHPISSQKEFQDSLDDEYISFPTTPPPLPYDVTFKDQAGKWRELAEGILQCKSQERIDSRRKRLQRAVQEPGDGVSEMLQTFADWISEISDDMDSYNLTSFKEDTQNFGSRSQSRKLSYFDFDIEPVNWEEIFSTPSRRTIAKHKKQNFWERFNPEPKPTEKPYETPDYSVLCSEDDYEVRLYNRSIWVSTTVTDFTLQTSGIRAFRRLFQYINGDNVPGIKIPTTVPVRSVVDTTCSPFQIFKKYTYSFYLPQEFWENIPEPTNKQVFIERSPEQIFYVTTFSGYVNSISVLYNLNKLQNALDVAQEPYITDKYYTSGYDPPMKVLDRRNEIWIPFNTTVRDGPVCLTSHSTTPSPLDHCKDIKCPQYEVLETLDEGVELRRYRNLTIVIKKSLTCNFVNAMSESYYPVQRYFGGYNSRNEMIPRMAPVLFSVDRPDNLPVTCAAVYQSAFIVPDSMRDNLPEPLDDSITIETIETLDVFVYTFEGNLKDDSFGKYEKLLELVGSRCIEEYPYVLAGYESPKKHFNKRNEVWIKLSTSCQEESTEEAPATTNVTPMETTRERVELPSFTLFPEIVLQIESRQRVRGFKKESDTNYETPEYHVIRKGDGYEVRTYNRSMWVSTKFNATYVQALWRRGQAFRKLNSYFTGNNKQGVEISMTAPVISHFDPQGSKTSTSYKFSFFLPKEFWDSPPEPLDEDVFVECIPDIAYYAHQFGGVVTDAIMDVHINMMKDALNVANETYNKDYVIAAGYDPPSKLLNRRNEIWIPMASSSEELECSEDIDIYPTNECTGNECPVYEVLKKYENQSIELRRYTDLTLVVKRSSACNYSGAVRESYMSLHNYFNGSNLLNMKIPRTAPVIIGVDRPDDRPQDCDAVYRIAYVAPDNYKYQLPEPIDELIYFEVYKSLEVFTYTFGGYMSNDTFKEYNHFKSVLNEPCVEEYPFILAGYSPPWQKVNRKNEVWLTYKPGCNTTKEIVNEVVEFPENTDNPDEDTKPTVAPCIAGIECPSYEVVAVYGNLEERSYEPAKWVCSHSRTCSIDFATSENFRRLYKYIAGTGNVEGKKIQMTSPVILNMNVDEIDKVSCKKKYKMCFYLPDNITPPTPTDAKVYLTKDKGKVVYVQAFGGRASSLKVKKITKQALQEFDKLGLSRRDHVYLSQYNKTSDTNRLNEIWIVKDTEKN